MHYYQFHIGDYKSHTHHLSLIEDLAYRRLLDHYYLHQEPIKQRDVARQIGMRDNEQEVLTVLDEFFVSTEAGYINPRADKEIKAFVEHQATSAYGAFCRTNKELVNLADKEVFKAKFLSGEHLDYIETLRAHHVSIMYTSSTDHATINQLPIPNTHIDTLSGSVIPTVSIGTLFDNQPIPLPNKTADCPHSEILALWAEKLPTAIQPADWNEKRQQALRSRWREKSNRQKLDWWAGFFEFIEKSDFLMGRTNTPGRKAFALSLDWLCKSENFLKVIEGRFHEQQQDAA